MQKDKREPLMSFRVGPSFFLKLLMELEYD